MYVEPIFSPKDVNNIWEIAGEFPELGGNITGSQVLYGERQWSDIATTFVTDGAIQYIQGYDGYAWYQKMSWPPLQGTDFGIGLFTEIPNKGYSGWVCSLEVSADYFCKSVYLLQESEPGMPVHDLVNENDWDDETWQCTVTKGDITDFAECIAYLPSGNNNQHDSVYRWSPENMPPPTPDKAEGFDQQVYYKSDSSVAWLDIG